jgi:hypothetical protein
MLPRFNATARWGVSLAQHGCKRPPIFQGPLTGGEPVAQTPETVREQEDRLAILVVMES